MVHTAATWKALAAGCVLSFTAAGCISISPEGATFSFRNLNKSKVEQASFSREAEEMLPEPKHPEKLKLAYARLMEESGKYPEARTHYLSALEDDSRNVEALIGAARMEMQLGGAANAEKHLKKAIKAAPDNAEAQFTLGMFYASQQKWEESISPLTKAMLASPNETRYRYQLAVSLVHKGDVDAALPHFIRTIGDAEAHYNVGLILQEEGRLDDAERHFLIAVNKKPELTQAQNWLAHLRATRAKAPGESLHSVPEEKADQVVPASHRSSAGVESTNPFAPRHLSAR
ncbi:tetratricopeptide repeat protein [Planctomicrobium sp. SH664]|uniref:tetratricopeptide repeat protein n=1 Tax=Planctomicrobium sp. SH664 TaxID=3448125 RepID=UPI003F5C3976